jgi:hypothetical protein
VWTPNLHQADYQDDDADQGNQICPPEPQAVTLGPRTLGWLDGILGLLSLRVVLETVRHGELFRVDDELKLFPLLSPSNTSKRGCPR